MDPTQIHFIWGIVALVCGAFMLTYGAQLFRFVLAFAGFYIGFTVGMLLPVPNAILEVLLAMVIGGVAAFVLYRLVSLTLFAAGALLGLVIGLLIGSFLPNMGGWLGPVIGLAGAAVGGIFGRSMGDIVMVLAAAAAGAYVSVIGLSILFHRTDPNATVEASRGLMPASAEAIAVLIVLLAVSILAQMQIMDLRQRLRRGVR